MNKLTKCFRFNKLPGVFQPNKLVFFQSKGFSDPFKKKEIGEEKNYINKQERDLLKKLMKKIKEDHNHESVEVNALKQLLGNHNISASDSLIKDIQRWRDEHH